MTFGKYRNFRLDVIQGCKGRFLVLQIIFFCIADKELDPLLLQSLEIELPIEKPDRKGPIFIHGKSQIPNPFNSDVYWKLTETTKIYTVLQKMEGGGRVALDATLVLLGRLFLCGCKKILYLLEIALYGLLEIITALLIGPNPVVDDLLALLRKPGGLRQI